MLYQTIYQTKHLIRNTAGSSHVSCLIYDNYCYIKSLGLHIYSNYIILKIWTDKELKFSIIYVHGSTLCSRSKSRALDHPPINERLESRVIIARSYKNLLWIYLWKLINEYYYEKKMGKGSTTWSTAWKITGFSRSFHGCFLRHIICHF